MFSARELNQFESNHFTVEQLDDGIFAAIHRDRGWAIANSGIIDLGDISLIFDTFLTVQAAEDLKITAEELTGKPVSIVVNSHYHNDHIWGNQVFDPQAQIISSDDTLVLIKIEGKEEYDTYKESSATHLRELRTKYYKENNEDRKNDLSTWISYYQGLVETFPILTVRLPNMTFNGRMNIHGTKLGIELISYKGGHTGCDTVLHIPSKGILFMGDLLFVGAHPYLADGDPYKLRSILNAIGSLDPKILVPGHGPVGRTEDLRLMIEYIRHCDQTGREMVERSQEERDIADYPIPEQYSGWIFPNFYSSNLKFFYNRYQTKIQEL